MYYVYMLRCVDNTIYTGITVDIFRRTKEHIKRKKKCAKYTRTHPGLKLEMAWITENRVLASKLEYNIKRLSKDKKERVIINGDLEEFLKDKVEIDKYILMDKHICSDINNQVLY